jgi:hypothetical protein
MARRIRVIGERLARAHGLDYNIECLEPNDPPFALAMVGVRAVVQMADPDAFPASGRDRKKFAKRVDRAIHGDGANRAAIFMAHAVPTIFSEWITRTPQAAGQDAETTAEYDPNPS